MPVDQTPITWADSSTALSDDTFNTEIRDAALLMLNPPMGSIRKASGTQSVAPNTLTMIVMDTLNFDTEDPATPLWSSVNPSRLTIRTPGWYEVTASVEFQATVACTATAGFRVNGATLYNGCSVTAPAIFGFLDLSPNSLILMNANDYVEFAVIHNANVNQNFAQSFFMPCLAVCRRRGI
jgi:hypothetical protein